MAPGNDGQARRAAATAQEKTVESDARRVAERSARRRADGDEQERGQAHRTMPSARPVRSRRPTVAGAGKEGVVVTEVDPDGAAAERGFKAGDVILEVGGKTVANAGRRPQGARRRAQGQTSAAC